VWEYNWHIHYSPILLRILAIILGLLSFFSFLGVISTMTGVANSSSVYFMAVHSGIPTFSGVLIFILITMGYAVYVTLWALFQMQFAGMMHLVPHRTSAVCLSFNARMCARLAAPMAFFYLGVSLIVLMLVILFIELSSYLSECSQLSETHVPPVCQALTCLIALSHVMCCAVLCCAVLRSTSPFCFCSPLSSSNTILFQYPHPPYLYPYPHPPILSSLIVHLLLTLHFVY
jgi:hypothetical protein